MKKKTLELRVMSAKNETAEAILTILNSLNQGQRKKILKNERVLALMERYGIEYED